MLPTDLLTSQMQGPAPLHYEILLEQAHQLVSPGREPYHDQTRALKAPLSLAFRNHRVRTFRSRAQDVLNSSTDSKDRQIKGSVMLAPAAGRVANKPIVDVELLLKSRR